MFRRWRQLAADVEVYAVELPGHGVRIREAPGTHLSTMVGQIAQAMLAYAEKPFAFFGHSMGALIAFELARRLRREAGIEPVHLFVSGREAPQVPVSDALYHTLPDDELKNALRDLNGTPTEVFESSELIQLVLPVLRADFELVETYVYSDDAPLSCPITAFGGKRDATVRAQKLEPWREQTTASFALRMFEGDHFFLRQAAEPLLRALTNELWRYAE